jgi:tetratricopeptide (TPR) repeat protein
LAISQWFRRREASSKDSDQTPAALMRQGNARLAEGRPDEAAEAYARACRIDPTNAAAFLNLGFAYKQAGRLAEAGESLTRAAALDAGLADPWLLLGQIAEMRGDLPRAIELVQSAIERKPDFLPGLRELCRMCLGAGDAARAARAADQGLALDGDAEELLFYRGALFQSEGRHEQAVACYQRAHALSADFPGLHLNLGLALRALGRQEQALASFERAAQLDPEMAEAHYQRALTLWDLRRLEPAEQALRQTLAIEAARVDACNQLGSLLLELGRHEEAARLFARARDAGGEAYGYELNMGNLLQAQRRLDEAEQAFRRAAALRADAALPRMNLGIVLQELGRPDEAQQAFRQALQLQPGDPTARFNLGLLLLRLGRMREAWPLHEARYEAGLLRAVTAPPPWPWPRWTGQSLQGRSIVVVPEQGSGDDIQFARYATMLKARGAARVTLSCKPALVDLMRSLQGVDAVLEQGEALVAHDYWVFGMSLPGLFDTTLDTIPAPIPYLKADPQRVRRWAQRLPDAPRRVGLVWKGSSLHANDAMRSLAGLEALDALWEIPGIAFVSLQKGQGEEQALRAQALGRLVHLGSDIDNFADTAAIVEQLDLVICVDTAVAHLAGALGKPCWALLPAHRTDWRWLSERADTPWYPRTMRLFRQRQAGDWQPTVAEVARELAAWARPGTLP